MSWYKYVKVLKPSYLELDFSYNERWYTLNEFVEAFPILSEVYFFLFPFILTWMKKSKLQKISQSKFHFSALNENIYFQRNFKIEIIMFFWFKMNGCISVERVDRVWSRARRRRLAVQPLVQIPSLSRLQQRFLFRPSRRLPPR